MIYLNIKMVKPFSMINIVLLIISFTKKINSCYQRYMYKIAIASFLQETNTFSPYKTSESDFTFAEGKDFYSNALKEKTEVKGFINILKKEKTKIIPIMGGWAVSSGKIKKKILH